MKYFNQILLSLFVTFSVYAQVNTGVPQPQFANTPAVSPGKSFSEVNSSQAQSTPKYKDSRIGKASLNYDPFNPNQGGGNMAMGATADDIVRQNNAMVMQSMGYRPPVIPPSDPVALHNFILQDYNSQSTQSKSMKECLDLINEVSSEGNSRGERFEYYKSPEFATKTKSYWDALNSLKAMQSGQKPISLRNAYFQLESAYGNTYLTYKEYNEALNSSVNFIKKWMVENKLNPKDNEALNYAIQKFMKDTLVISNSNPDSQNPNSKTFHFPFRYDYIDFQGEKDFRNYFITKCVATGYGQCNSLPGNYLCFAEGLGAKAYLSLAPQHSFIKYPDDNGNIHNYEPTSNWNISDKWYQDNMFIGTKAKNKGIYLDTMNRRQIIADCMVDLAFGYMTKYGVADTKFVNDCIQSAMKEFPKNNNIRICFTYSKMLAGMLDRELYKCGIKDLKDIEKCPSAQQLYLELKKNEELISQLGYQEIPEKMYLEMMQLHTDRGTTQIENNINTKQKRNLFITK